VDDGSDPDIVGFDTVLDPVTADEKLAVVELRELGDFRPLSGKLSSRSVARRIRSKRASAARGNLGR